MGVLDGKVVLVTVAARGQGRAHAVTSAPEGADVVPVGVNSDLDAAPYPLSSEEDLAKTVHPHRRAPGRLAAAWPCP